MTLEMASPLEVGIACRDLTRMRRFYEQVLGFSFISEYHVAADKAAESALSAGSYTVVRLQTSNGERIKLLAPATPVPAEAPAAYILDKSNATYLTFIIEDIQAAIARLLQEGIVFMTGDKPVEVRPGVYLAFCRDPEGNVLELVQYEDISTYRTDLKQRNF
ncbi:VOC family protein [Pusillimonas sp. TS35]|uniref:VOC family protein n=1 Tax=Paracandidimonas lactea TaxID=2895524 RepID=UPI00136E428E|nr:VOC family protein [Paracandidimonas lactea]MYN12723.1 VOC family protein [Pusillimonas sp. TS35]